MVHVCVGARRSTAELQWYDQLGASGFRRGRCTAQALLTLPGASEGDGSLSGLIVDVLGDTLVVASSAAWVERYRPDIEACLTELTGDQQRLLHVGAQVLSREPLAAGCSSGGAAILTATARALCRPGAPGLEAVGGHAG